MVYREGAGPEEEVLETYSLSRARGANVVGVLFGFALVFAVTLVVSVIVEPPPEIDRWVWTFPVAMAAFGIPAIWLQARRRRTLRFVRLGTTVRLVVDGEVTLVFPIVVSGDQVRMNGYSIFLKLVDGERRAILLQEIRGLAYGLEPNWLDRIDRDAPAAGYECKKLGDVARIRTRVEELNEGDQPSLVEESLSL